MNAGAHRDLPERLAREEARLRALNAERDAAARHVEALRLELARQEGSTDFGPAVPTTPQPPRSSDEKVRLFRGLFRGRPDVFAKHWHNPRKNKSGYAPACASEWVRGVCEKPRVKCGECPNQAFRAVTDRVIRDHLQGRHVAGVYPLLLDETCWFLALDFDGGKWRDEVSVFVDTCRGLGLAPAVERSRSGHGAHVWLFFSEAVPARTARQLGCHLLTETMERQHEMPMTSYDRLFPNQDTLPRGGFGNLIALPLQPGPRREGNTVFLRDDGSPHPDQWAYLAALPRVEPARVAEIAREALEGGRVVGVRPAEAGGPAPGTRHNRRATPGASLEGGPPETVGAVLTEQLFVDKEGLPGPLVNRVKRLAAFENPEFHKKQALRLSTALTPRVISCAEDLPDRVGLPRGCVPALEDLLRSCGVALRLEDRRSQGEPLEASFHGDLHDVQARAARALLAHDTGVFVAPPGSGKTVVGTYLVASRRRNTLVLVHRTQLLEQWRSQLSVFLDVAPARIGQVGGGRHKVTGGVDVAMLQSLVRRGQVDDLVATYGHVIVDECHHVPAVSFEKVMRRVRARYVAGLTATPVRRDGHQPILEFQLGPVRFTIDAKSQAARQAFEHRLVVRHTAFRLRGESADPGIQQIYGELTTDRERNEMILDDVVAAVEEGRSPIVLSERRDHVEYLAERLRGFARHLVVLRGGMGVRQRRQVAEQLSSIPADEERLLLATGRFLGEGFDDARLDTLFLAMPVSWRGTLVQYAGRLHRTHHGKVEVRIYDYVDGQVPVLERMFAKRLRGYRSMGYEVGESGAGRSEPVVEYDQATSRPQSEELF